MKLACLAAGLMTTFTEHTLLVLSSALCPERTDGEGTTGRKGRETPSRGAERTLNQESGTLTSDWAVLLICCVTVGKSLALSGPECLYSKMKWLDLIRNP